CGTINRGRTLKAVQAKQDRIGARPHFIVGNFLSGCVTFETKKLRAYSKNNRGFEGSRTALKENEEEGDVE
ncbi:unnamed protein product, partial [Dovyalis caffra]